MIKIKKRYVNPSEEYRDYFSNREYFITKFNDFTYNDRFKWTMYFTNDTHMHLLYHLWIKEVQIRLFLWELMQIIRLTFISPFPHWTTENAHLRENMCL